MAFLSDMRGVAKDSLIYGASSSLSRMMSLITAPIVTRILSPEDYGVVALVQLAIGFFVILASMNLGSGISYYYYKEMNKGDGKENIVLSTGLYVTALFGLIISAGLILFAEPLASLLEIRSDGDVSSYDLVTFIRLSALGLFFSLIISSAQIILRLWRKPLTYLKIDFVGIILGLILVFVLIVWMRVGVIGLFWMGVISPAITMLFALYAIRHAIQKALSFSLLGLVCAYCLPQLPGVFVNWAQTQLGRGFVNYYASLEELGLYSIAFSLSMVFVIAVTAFRLAYDPYALSIMNRPEAKKTYSLTYGLYTPCFAALAGITGIFSKPALMILTPAAYHDAYYLVPFFVVAAFYMGANNILGTGIWISKKTGYTSLAQVAAFVTLIIASFILTPLYQGIGAAIAYLLATLAQSFAYYYFAQKLWPVPYDYWRTHWAIGAVLLVAVTHNILITDFGFWASSCSALCASLILLWIIWLIGVSPSHKKLVTMRLLLWWKEHKSWFLFAK